jgi:energy-coupling factor transporter ATP-binding protein EcfA2
VITEIEIEGFKSLERVSLKLGRFNLFVGANGSGKSNFLDALRVLQGIGYGFSIGEIFDGKPKGAANDVWPGIRGGSARAPYHGRSAASAGGVQFALKLNLQDSPALHYSIWFLPTPGEVQEEELTAGSQSVFERDLGTLAIDLGAGKEVETSGLDPTRPALASFQAFSIPQHQPTLSACRQALRNMQRIDPVPARLREYSQLGAVRMGEQGENFAAVVGSILENEELRRAYLSWLQQLTPTELDDITILKGALGEPLFAIRENGQTMPAPVLSDGTLRFAAITAAFFQHSMPDIITIEEIENGIHPTRLRLLVELLKSQSTASGPQIFATTHSPVVLAWLDESDYETTFFCKRDEETGASVIKPLSEIPRLLELVKNQPLGELFTEGWMEAAF